ncbi:MAG: hypothetical protein R3Y46_03425 [Opitutales bacterium]
MNFPDTPKTIISQLTQPDKIEIWNGAWRRFFDIYHAPIKLMVSNSFYKRSFYNIPPYIIDDIVGNVIVSLNRIFQNNAYDSSKVRFRSFLKTICDRRVIDYLRENVKSFKFDSIDDEESSSADTVESIYAQSQKEKLNEEEDRAFKMSLILDAYMSIRHNFDAQTCTAFEMIKLEGAKVEEVVRELGVSSNIINNAVYRITKKLKETISKDDTMKG